MMRKAFVITLALLFVVSAGLSKPKTADPTTLPLTHDHQIHSKRITADSPIEHKFTLPQRERPEPRRDPEAELNELVEIGDDFIVGYTYYDYQANGSVRKQIVRDSYGGVQFIWMNGYDSGLVTRHMTYNYLHYLDARGDVVEGELMRDPDQPLPVDQDDRTGYGMLDVYTYDPDDEFYDDVACAFYHSVGYEGAPDDVSPATAVALDFQRSAGAFEGVVLNPWQGSMAIWPGGGVDRNGYTHVFSCEYHGEDADENWHRVGYWRGDYDDANFSWDWPEIPVTIDTTSVISQVVATSPTSDKVALGWHHNRIGIAEPGSPWAEWGGLWQRNNDLWYMESDDGEEWDLEDAMSISKIIPPRAELWETDREEAYGDTFRPYSDVDLQYDPWGDDELYAVFAAANFSENVIPIDGRPADSFSEMGHLWFWTTDPETGLDTLTMIANGHYYNRTNNQGVLLTRCGSWRINTDRGSIAFNPEDEGTIYVVWSWFPQIMDYDFDLDEWNYFDPAARDTSLLGHLAAEVMLSVSTDYGLHWQEPINLTNTRWEEEDPPDPVDDEFHWSENWPSVAKLADDTLHIMYVLDGYAGGVPQDGEGWNEGPATDNKVIYHRVALDDIDHDGDLVEIPDGFQFHNYLDLKPIPKNTLREPGVPTPDGDVTITVQVDVSGDQVLETVELIYVINGLEDDAATVEMDPVQDQEGFFTATIPAQDNGREVWYRVRAENTQGFDKYDPDDFSGKWYYSYISRTDGNLSIRDVQLIQGEDWPIDYSGYRGYEVTLSGVINTPSSFNDVFGAYGMQDDEALWSGIFIRGIEDELAVGQEITVTGTVMERDPEDASQWEYATYIAVTDYSTGDMVDAPVPLDVEMADLRFQTGAEDHEGLLVEAVNFDIGEIDQDEAAKGFWPAIDNTVNPENGERGWISNNGLSLQDAESVEFTREYISQGTNWVSMIGVFTESWGHYAITPRTPGDVGPQSVGDDNVTSPYRFSLEPAYPNPFNSTTNINFELRDNGWTKLAVYDLSGRIVAEVFEGEIKAGRHQLSIDASSLSTGVYVLRLETLSLSASQKLVLVK